MAAQEKEKGNAAFKAGDYPTAIGHYSAAIHADRTDATLPLNRAAAYLKLGKNEDAERDCSTVLTLSKGNTKALFRRAQARVELGKLSEAHEDLKEAAKLEPANQSVKQELNKVVALIQQAAKKKPQTVAADASPAPKRRRIPITIVEADGRRSTPTPVDASNAPSSSTPKSAAKPTPKPSVAESPAADLMKPVSSRSLNAPSPNDTPSSTAAPAPKLQPTPKPSFKDAKSARESSKPSRVGGGIFRASGESTIFSREVPAKQDAPANEPATKPTPPAKQEQVPSPPPAPVPTQNVSPPVPVQKSVLPAAANVKSPMSLFDFTRAWESTPDSAARLKLLCVRPLTSSHLILMFALTSGTYIQQTPPAALPALFQTSLDPALFVDIVDVLGTHTSTNADRELVAGYMHAFGSVARFGTVARLLSRAEKARVRGVWGVLGVGAEGSEAGLPPQLEEVWAPVYR
ncbi:hypothetical protein MSAN_02237500 [Mycena sanguinolenta]|uniref:RNA polymerase II-associated protein 3 n=1 Tax=Mycena sanguinolenta TaxID=230812 RepID=A0A8H6XBN0_9AGAR|nr:hypothetical protein MSAN_02237500 [Mycena sanguinolenta]